MPAGRTQISAFVSDSTQDALERYAEAHGLERRPSKRHHQLTTRLEFGISVMRHLLKKAIGPRFDAAGTWLGHKKDAVVDIASYARGRLGYGPRRPAEHAFRALNRIVADAKVQLFELKTSVAICIADHKQMVKFLELEASNVAEWNRRAAKADEEGEARLADWARGAAQDHQRTLERARTDAEKLGRRVESLKRELRAFSLAIEDASAATNLLRADEQFREAKVTVEGPMRHVQALAGALSAISTLGEDQSGHDPS